jgi:hypothetical protein
MSGPSFHSIPIHLSDLIICSIEPSTSRSLSVSSILNIKVPLEKRKEIEANKKKIEWGSQIRNYVMHPYKLVKDVRTGHESGNVEAIMDGEINEFLKSYLMTFGN